MTLEIIIVLSNPDCCHRPLSSPNGCAWMWSLLLVLGSLAVAGLVTPSEALSGFSNPAVVTVWAVLILSGGLARTGVAGLDRAASDATGGR